MYISVHLRISKTVPDTRKPNQTDTGSGKKKSQTEAFGSVSVFASGVTGSFRFHCFPARDRVSSLCEGERGRVREGGRGKGEGD